MARGLIASVNRPTAARAFQLPVPFAGRSAWFAGEGLQRRVLTEFGNDGQVLVTAPVGDLVNADVVEVIEPRVVETLG